MSVRHLPCLLLALAVVGGAPGAASADTASAGAPCRAASDATAQRSLIHAYRAAGPLRARAVHGRSGALRRVMVDIPPIAFRGPGVASTLPVGPCQTIYRFAFPRIQDPGGHRASPYRYAEVDWNTEGLPRGPNGSFSSPHFDFHFYLLPRKQVDRRTRCISTNGRTCDPRRTPYAPMRRLLEVPPAAFLPSGFFADPGSAIPGMGLHLLDGRATYTVEAVDHHPTLIYGSVAGKVLFSEASVTLQTLQDAMAAPGHELSFPYRQPRRVAGDAAWPTRFVVRYRPESRTFSAGFAGFHHVGRHRRTAR